MDIRCKVCEVRKGCITVLDHLATTICLNLTCSACGFKAKTLGGLKQHVQKARDRERGSIAHPHWPELTKEWMDTLMHHAEWKKHRPISFGESVSAG